MASTNKTTHYELSQFLSSDIPAWLIDYNGDMLKIDTAINSAKTTADNAGTAASNAQSAAEGAQNTANTAVTNAATAQSTADGANTKIGTLANLTTTAKTDLVSAINEVDEDVSAIANYSSNEQAIGTWIDGKTIYRKVVDTGALPNATTKTISAGISNIDTVVKLTGIANDSNEAFPLPLISSANLSGQVTLFYDKTSNNIQLSTNVDRSSVTSSYVIVEYTKIVI